MKTKDIIINKIYQNNNGDEYKVLELAEKTKSGHKKFKIKFLETGFETIVWQHSIINGCIKDKFKPSVFGVGCIGNATSKGHMKEWNLWHNMLSRCYNTKSKDYNSYGKIGVHVHKEWLCFENFINDLKNIEGYNEELFLKGEIVLDKDLKQQDIDPGDKIYSKETCCFINKKLNEKLRNSNKYKKQFIAIDPKGNKIEVTGIIDYCNKNNLEYSSIRKCLKGTWKQYKKWHFIKI